MYDIYLSKWRSSLSLRGSLTNERLKNIMTEGSFLSWGIERRAGMTPWCAAATTLAQYEWMKTLTSSVGNENRSSHGKNPGNKL